MVYLFLADGFEELEAMAPLDLLRRAKVPVQTVSIHETRRNVCGSHGMTLTADLLLSEAIGLPDMAILPGGGKGVENLSQSDDFCRLMRTYHTQDVVFAAICAAPTLLSSLGILEGRKVTCYPSCATEVSDGCYVEKPVCVEEGLITSEGAGTAVEFGLKLVEYFTNEATAKALARSICFEKD